MAENVVWQKSHTFQLTSMTLPEKYDGSVGEMYNGRRCRVYECQRYIMKVSKE